MQHSHLDKESMLPIYFQIAQQIRQHISQQCLIEGDLIASERELCEMFGVSRMTVRQAVDTLVNEGLLERHRGRGTFVTAPKINQPLAFLTGFTADTLYRGMLPSSTLVSLGVIAASAKVAEKLAIVAGQPVVRLVRVRRANGEPHALERSHLLCDEALPLLRMDLAGRSLYQALSEECGLQLARARQSIEAKNCSPEICRRLNIPVSSIIFYIERVTFDQRGRAVEYVESNYRTDKFRFEVELAIN